MWGAVRAWSSSILCVKRYHWLLLQQDRIFFSLTCHSKPFQVASSVQSLSCVRLFATPWTVACQTSLSITNSQSLLKLMSIESVMPFISCSVIPFSSHFQSFPASGSFPISRLFTSGGQSTEASASVSVLPMNIFFRIDWFDLLAV